MNLSLSHLVVSDNIFAVYCWGGGVVAGGLGAVLKREINVGVVAALH
jgi:hypothetical protein